MKLKVLFLTIIIILVVATIGTYWVWEKKENIVTSPPVSVGLPPVPNMPDEETATEVIEPKIDPVTGWKIFEHPQVPITFEYPGEMKVTDISFSSNPDRLPGAFITVTGANYHLGVNFALPNPEIGGGYEWNFAGLLEKKNIVVGGKKFETSIRGDLPDSSTTMYYDATALPTPFVVIVTCNDYTCSQKEVDSFFRQFVSSIKILPE